MINQILPLQSEMIDNAFAFLIASIANDDTSFALAIDLDDDSICEFGDDFDFDISSFRCAARMLKTLRAAQNRDDFQHFLARMREF